MHRLADIDAVVDQLVDDALVEGLAALGEPPLGLQLARDRLRGGKTAA
jgi:hypothetical protein